MRAIFISYRRHDSEGEAGRLFDDLVAHFGEASVFMDVVTIQAGRDFRKAIDDSVSSCGVLLALMGPGWLEATDEGGARRLDDARDFVRIETAAALRRDVPVIPILLRGAKMPRAEQLPAELTDLAYRNAVELTHARWKSDVQVLIGALRPLVIAATETVVIQPTRQIPERTAASPTTGSSAGKSTGEPMPALDAVAISIVTRDLAQYIGPVAELVVKRAAGRSATIADLRRAVAEEIDSLSHRARFLERGGGG